MFASPEEETAWNNQQRLAEDSTRQERQRYPDTATAAHDNTSLLSPAADIDDRRETSATPAAGMDSRRDADFAAEDARLAPSPTAAAGNPPLTRPMTTTGRTTIPPWHDDDAAAPQDNPFDQLLQKPSTPLPTYGSPDPATREEEPVDIFALEQTARLVEARLTHYHVKAEVVGISPEPGHYPLRTKSGAERERGADFQSVT